MKDKKEKEKEIKKATYYDLAKRLKKQRKAKNIRKIWEKKS